MNIKIKFIDDAHLFKAGTEKSICGGSVTFVVGGNGCGKSTFMRLLRNSRDDLAEANRKLADGMVPEAIEKLKPVRTEIEGLEGYSHCFYLDASADNPMSFENSASAGGLIGTGALQMMKKSRGEASMMLLNRFMAQVGGAIKNKHDDSRCLIVLDEVDEGMDPGAQANLAELLYTIEMAFDADIVCITHSIIPVMASFETSVYDFAGQATVPLDEYISRMVHRKVTIGPADE